MYLLIFFSFESWFKISAWTFHKTGTVITDSGMRGQTQEGKACLDFWDDYGSPFKKGNL
jgi:hypothetical protein